MNPRVELPPQEREAQLYLSKQILKIKSVSLHLDDGPKNKIILDL